MPYSFPRKFKSLSIKFRPSRSSTNGETQIQGKLAATIQTLLFAEKVAEASSVPFLKGTIGIAIVVAECARGFQSNNAALEKLALGCADLMVDISKRVESGPDVSEELSTLIADLFKPLEEVKNFATQLSSGNRTWQALTQQEIKDKINDFHRDINDAHQKFQTLSTIVKDQSEASQDITYPHGNIEAGDIYTTGSEWVAFGATLADSRRAILVKRYTSENPSRRKTMYIQDLTAFKKLWHPHLVSYMGGSSPREEYPYIVLKGVTSDHVCDYIADQFTKDNREGSRVALTLLRDLANALAYTVGITYSCSFDISKVHLNDSGQVILVDLEPHKENTQLSKNEMLHWRSWQEICIELLSGDLNYEPNPSIEHATDLTLQSRLEYLRPILGHIHSGGLRFKDRVGAAFQRQALMLSQSVTRLKGVQGSTVLGQPQQRPAPTLLRALWPSLRNMHYVSHFKEPLDINVGDVGYLRGSPPRFTCLENTYTIIGDIDFPPGNEIQVSRHSPRDRWSTQEVNGIIRHGFYFRDSDATNLTDWSSGRPRLDKDFKLGRINKPSENGVVVDCTRAWDWLENHAEEVISGLEDPSIKASNLILVVYTKQQSGHVTFRLNREVDAEKWRAVWVKEGLDTVPEAIYFYESPPGGVEGVWGYFSFSPEPGNPHPNWTPDRDDAGEPWGWTFVSEDWTIEISKPNVKQYIRYVQL